MKKILGLLLIGLLIFPLTGCLGKSTIAITDASIIGDTVTLTFDIDVSKDIIVTMELNVLYTETNGTKISDEWVIQKGTRTKEIEIDGIKEATGYQLTLETLDEVFVENGIYDLDDGFIFHTDYANKDIDSALETEYLSVIANFEKEFNLTIQEDILYVASSAYPYKYSSSLTIDTFSSNKVHAFNIIDGYGLDIQEVEVYLDINDDGIDQYYQSNTNDWIYQHHIEGDGFVTEKDGSETTRGTDFDLTNIVSLQKIENTESTTYYVVLRSEAFLEAYDDACMQVFGELKVMPNNVRLKVEIEVTDGYITSMKSNLIYSLGSYIEGFQQWDALTYDLIYTYDNYGMVEEIIIPAEVLELKPIE